MFLLLQKMVSLLVSGHFNIVSHTHFTQEVLLYNLESLARYSAIFCVIHEIVALLIHECSCQRIWVLILKLDVINPRFCLYVLPFYLRV